MHIESLKWPSNWVRDFVIVLQDLCADILNRKPDALMSKLTKDKHWQKVPKAPPVHHQPGTNPAAEN